ncbi:MAG: hypothetical protein U0746_02770 [Gemmataceae bacterium]
MNRRQFGLLLAGAVVGASLGCSSGSKAVPITAEEAVKKKVDAMNRIAAEVAKDPKSNETLVAVDEFANIFFDPKAHPNEAKAILDTYEKSVKGKLKGETAQQLQVAVDQLRAKK